MLWFIIKWGLILFGLSYIAYKVYPKAKSLYIKIKEFFKKGW